MLRFLTSGESHGSCLVAILEGMVSGLKVNKAAIDHELKRRQCGYGRGGRMSIEKDTVEILSGLRQGVTLGSPIALRVNNRDFKIDELPVIKRPRPGHADLPGALKYDRRDIRDILERSSARETASRVAVGGVCRQFLQELGVEILSHVTEIGGVKAPVTRKSFEIIRRDAEKSQVRCQDAEASKRMVQKIEAIKRAKDTVGGIFEIRIKGVLSGIGRPTTWEKALAARLTFGLASIQAVKAVEIESGIEGGASDGRLIVIRAAMKPIATLMQPLRTVDIDSKKPALATVERSDVTAVPACGVVGEAMAAFQLANCYLEKFGGDSLKEVRRNLLKAQ